MTPSGPSVTDECRQAVIAAVLKWSEDFIEQPHEIFGGLPICPFARSARLRRTIRFEVRAFSMADPLEADGELLSLVTQFVEQAKHDGPETLFVIHPDRAQRLQDLEAFVRRLNARMADGSLRAFQAFEAHPDSQLRVGDVYTRRSPFPETRSRRRPAGAPHEREEGRLVLRESPTTHSVDRTMDSATALCPRSRDRAMVSRENWTCRHANGWSRQRTPLCAGGGAKPDQAPPRAQ